jgi:hypothetical protein
VVLKKKKTERGIPPNSTKFLGYVVINFDSNQYCMFCLARNECRILFEVINNSDAPFTSSIKDFWDLEVASDHPPKENL